MRSSTTLHIHVCMHRKKKKRKEKKSEHAKYSYNCIKKDRQNQWSSVKDSSARITSSIFHSPKNTCDKLPQPFIYTYAEQPWHKAKSTSTVLIETTRWCCWYLQVVQKPELCAIHRKKWFQKKNSAPACEIQWETACRVRIRSEGHTVPNILNTDISRKYVTKWEKRSTATGSHSCGAVTAMVAVYTALSGNSLFLSMCTMYRLHNTLGLKDSKIVGNALGSFCVDNPAAMHCAILFWPW